MVAMFRDVTDRGQTVRYLNVLTDLANVKSLD